MTADVNALDAVLAAHTHMHEAAAAHLCALLAYETRAAGIRDQRWRIMKAAKGPVELPVAGSSGIPYSGANIRE